MQLPGDNQDRRAGHCREQIANNRKHADQRIETDSRTQSGDGQRSVKYARDGVGLFFFVSNLHTVSIRSWRLRFVSPAANVAELITSFCSDPDTP
jgi:hypothetical protein